MKSRFFVRLAASSLIALAAHAGAAEPPPLEVYGALPTFDDATISPSGEQIAVLLNTAGKRQITIIGPDHQPTRALEFGDTKLRDFSWIGEEALLATYSQTEELPLGFVGDQQEFYRTLIIPNDEDGEVQSIFANRRDIMKAVFGTNGVRRVGDRFVGFFEGVQFRNVQGEWQFEHGRPSLFKVDLTTNRPELVAGPASESRWRDWIVDGNGTVAATFDMDTDSGRWTIRNGTDKLIAEGLSPDGDAGLVTLGATGETLIYFIGSEEENSAQRFEIPLAGGEAKEILAGVNVERIFTDRYSGRMLGYLRGGSNPVPVFTDPAHQAAAQTIFGSTGVRGVRLVSWSTDFSKAIVRTTGDRNAGTWFLIDTQAGQATRLGSERPDIPPDQVGPVSVVRYSAQDGLELDGILTLPPQREARNLPVIILPHGGPHSHDEATFDWWAQAFASRGYAVFQPNFRGSTNRDRAFEALGNGQWGRAMQTDLSDGLKALAEKGIVDPERACIVGASYGGYAALAGVTIQHGIYRCAVAVAPVTDLALTFQRDELEASRGKISRHNMLEELGPRDLFDDYSPRDQAAKADAPILLIHGRDDTVVPFEQSSRMADALKDAGKPYKFVELRAEDHWLSRSETRNQMLHEAVAFVQEHNPAD